MSSHDTEGAFEARLRIGGRLVGSSLLSFVVIVLMTVVSTGKTNGV